jgi:hypothetical protein
MQTLYSTVPVQSNKNTQDELLVKLNPRSIIRQIDQHEHCSFMCPKHNWGVLVSHHTHLYVMHVFQAHIVIETFN